jgi:TonB-linked SusC/RagA family outer membrane protein
MNKRKSIFIVVFTVLTFCNSYSNNLGWYNEKEYVSIDMKLSAVLDRIAEHYDVNIIYDNEHVKNIIIPDFKVLENISSDLKKILTGTKLIYKAIDENTYIIKKGITKNKPEKPSAIISEATIEKLSVSGIVLDSESRESLIGVNIVELDGSNGTISDYEGKFEISIEKGKRLEVSYIGYETQTITVESSGNLEVLLVSSSSVLDEVIVVGYGSQKKSDLTGAVSSIGVKELKQLPSTGLEQAIQGRSAGVFVTQNSGSPGGAMSIRIRGTGSTLTAEPLYVIDGIPIVNDNAGTSSTFDVDGGGQFSNALTTINPNDIESIEILKDASATAIYGSRAANGVVLITTKKGKEGQQSASYETYVGIQQLYKDIPVMGLRDYADYLQDTGQGDLEEFQNKDLLGEGTNWQDVIFREALMYNHQFSLTGGNQDTRFSLTAGLHQKDGIVQGSDFRRYSSKLNVSHTYSDKISLGMNLLTSRTKENIVFNDNSNGVIYTALLTPPIVPERTLTGDFGTPPSGENIVLQFNNPLASALEISDVNTKNRILGSVFVDYNITDWLKYRLEFATDILYTNHNTFWPAFDRDNQQRKSKVRRNNNNSLYWINKHLLTFDKRLSKKQKLTFLAGFEAQQGNYEWLSAERENLPTNELQQLTLGDAATQKNSGGAGHWSLLSYFGRANYAFDERYLFTGTLRSDGSSRFGENNKYGLFPSLAFAWRLSNESFLRDSEKLYNLKLRLGYGAVGNQEIGLYSFAQLLRSQDVVIGNQQTTGFAGDNIANPNVKWESSVQFNGGLDIGFFDNKLEIVIDVYNKQSKDMLLPAILPATAGSFNAPFVNIGEMRNSGVEFTLNTQNLTGAINWRTSANISINRNEIVDLGSTGSLPGIVQRVPITRTEEGLPIGQYYGHVALGIFESQEEVEAAAFQEIGTRAGDIQFEDLNADGVINEEDRTFIGSPHPDYTINLINDITVGNFDFNIFARGVFGNEVYNLLRRDLAGTGAWVNQSVDVIDRWTPTNPDGSEPRANGNDPNANRRVSSRFVEDGTFIRIQNAALGYTMPRNKLSQYGISNLRIYVSGQNLATWTKYSGYDPEIGSYNQNPLINGVDNGRFPVARSITFGLNLNF